MGDIKAPKFTGTGYSGLKEYHRQMKNIISKNSYSDVDVEEYDLSLDDDKSVSEISTDIDESVDVETNSKKDKYGLGEDSVKDYYKKVKAIIQPKEINNNYENETDADVDVDVKEKKTNFPLEFEVTDYLGIEISIENDQKMYDIITASISDLEAEIKEKEKNLTSISSAGTSNFLYLANPDLYDEHTKEKEQLTNEIASLKSDLATLKTYQSELKKRIDLITGLKPYQEKMKTGDYQQFSTTYKIRGASSWIIDSQLLADCFYDKDMYITEVEKKYSIKISQNDIDEFAWIEYILQNKKDGKSNDEVMMYYPELQEKYEQYKYLSDNEIMMYHYLCKTEGRDSAEAYLKVLENEINKAQGTDAAINFINNLDLTDEGKLTASLDNLFDVNGKGFVDGIDTFFEGLDNVFQNNGTMSATDYEKAIVLQYLQQNSELFDEMYEFSSAFGNMVPSILASFAVSMVASPLAGAEVMGVSQAGNITGSTLMGLSAMGNAKHQALIGGADPVIANIYGILIGLSETTLIYFLGNIPGLSETAGLTIVGMLKEGVEEYLQEWIAAGLQAVLLGEDVDWDSVPENAQKSFWMGVLMSGFLNSGQSIVNLMINGDTVQINVEETLEYINKYPETNVVDAIMKNNPELVTKLNNNQSEIIEKYNDTSHTINLNEIMQKSDFNKTNLIEGIINEIPEGLDTLTKARIIYLKLNESVNYSDEYFAMDMAKDAAKENGNIDFVNQQSEILKEMYYKKYDISNMDNNNVICSNWAQIYKELLIQAGIDESSVHIVYATSSEITHQWIKIDLGDGNILFADATFNFGGLTDLVNSKLGMSTKGFVLTTEEEWNKQTQRYSDNITAFKNLVKYGKKQSISDIDKTIGYGQNSEYSNAVNDLLNNYYPETGQQIDFISKLNTFKSIFDNNMNAIDNYPLYSKNADLIFGDNCSVSLLSNGTELKTVVQTVDNNGNNLYFVKTGNQNLKFMYEFEYINDVVGFETIISNK